MPTSAEEYRARDSAEIEKEQIVYERLKRSAVLDDLPRIEWDISDRTFHVTKAWERMSGYSREDMFGDAFISEDTNPEGLMDDLIDMFVNTVLEADQDFVSSTLKKDLLLSRKENSVTRVACQVVSKTGEKKPVRLFVRVLRKSGQLANFTCIAFEAQKYASREEYRSLEKEVKSNKGKIEVTNKKIAEISKANAVKMLTGIPTLLAALLTALIAFNDFIEGAAQEVAEIRKRIFAKPGFVRSPSSAWSDLPIDEVTLQKVKAIMLSHRADGTQIGLYQYEPTDAPKIVAPLAIAGKEKGVLDAAQLSPFPVNATDFIAGRTEDHVQGKSVTITVNGRIQHSLPFEIDLSKAEGRKADSSDKLLLFVEIISKQNPSEVKDAAYVLSQEISAAIENAEIVF